MLESIVSLILGELEIIFKIKKQERNCQINPVIMILLLQLSLLMKSHLKKSSIFLKIPLVSVVHKICQSMLPDLLVTLFTLLKEVWKIGDMLLDGKMMLWKMKKVKKTKKIYQLLKNVYQKIMEKKNSYLILELTSSIQEPV